jgi:hypothetical protein
LEEFQKMMEEEQAKFNEANRMIDPEVATSITRRMRKFYNATRQVPILSKFTHICNYVQIFVTFTSYIFVTFNQSSLVGQVFSIILLNRLN